MSIPQPSKLEIDLAEIKRHLEFRAKVNQANLEDIVWAQDGKPLNISSDAIKEWAFIGLSNIDFAKELLNPGTHVLLKIYQSKNGNIA